MSKRNEMHTSVKATALGGMMAGLAIVIMCLGGLVPLATFVCPVLCMLLLQYVLRLCGRRIGCAWYGAVAILSMLMGPDKEAATFFVFIGYYPLVKPGLEKLQFPWLWKLLLFNVSILTMYWIMIHFMGMAALATEFQDMGRVLMVITLVLGNLTFALLDKILVRRFRRK